MESMRQKVKKEQCKFIHPMRLIKLCLIRLFRTHRETGRKMLFINPVYTLEIEGLGKEESDMLLFELYSHMGQEKIYFSSSMGA